MTKYTPKIFLSQKILQNNTQRCKKVLTYKVLKLQKGMYRAFQHAEYIEQASNEEE